MVAPPTQPEPLHPSPRSLPCQRCAAYPLQSHQTPGQSQRPIALDCPASPSSITTWPLPLPALCKKKERKKKLILPLSFYLSLSHSLSLSFSLWALKQLQHQEKGLHTWPECKSSTCARTHTHTATDTTLCACSVHIHTHTQLHHSHNTSYSAASIEYTHTHTPYTTVQTTPNTRHFLLHPLRFPLCRYALNSLIQRSTCGAGMDAVTNHTKKAKKSSTSLEQVKVSSWHHTSSGATCCGYLTSWTWLFKERQLRKRSIFSSLAPSELPKYMCYSRVPYFGKIKNNEDKVSCKGECSILKTVAAVFHSL